MPLIAKQIAEKPELSRHSRLGAYMMFDNKVSEDPIVDLILFKIVLSHHGDLTNFIADKNNNNLVVITQYLNELEVQIKHIDFELYTQIIERHGLSAKLENWEKIIMIKVKFLIYKLFVFFQWFTFCSS